MITMNTTTPKIYVACLASYNSGILHGAWIDATNADTIREEVAAMLAKSPEAGAEEWAIHDTDGFEGIAISEWEDFETVAQIAAAIAEHGEIFIAAKNNFYELSDALEALENYAGTARTLEDWCSDYADETGLLTEMPESLRPYFDFEAYAHDMDLNGDIWTADGGDGVLVFWNR